MLELPFSPGVADVAAVSDACISVVVNSFFFFTKSVSEFRASTAQP